MEHGTTPSAPRPEHFRAIYEALPDPAGITRVADGMYLEVNPAFCQLLGMSREQILGRTSTELSIWATNQERSKLVTTLQREGKVQNLPLNAQRNGRAHPRPDVGPAGAHW
jgi:PAS domain S-box-containing protein